MNSVEHSLLLYFLDAVRSAPHKTSLLCKYLNTRHTYSFEFMNYVNCFTNKTKDEVLIIEKQIRKEIR